MGTTKPSGETISTVHATPPVHPALSDKANIAAPGVDETSLEVEATARQFTDQEYLDRERIIRETMLSARPTKQVRDRQNIMRIVNAYARSAIGLAATNSIIRQRTMPLEQWDEH